MQRGAVWWARAQLIRSYVHNLLRNTQRRHTRADAAEYIEHEPHAKYMEYGRVGVRWWAHCGYAPRPLANTAHRMPSSSSATSDAPDLARGKPAIWSDASKEASRLTAETSFGAYGLDGLAFSRRCLPPRPPRWRCFGLSGPTKEPHVLVVDSVLGLRSALARGAGGGGVGSHSSAQLKLIASEDSVLADSVRAAGRVGIVKDSFFALWWIHGNVLCGMPETSARSHQARKRRSYA